jgi:ribosomal protein S13
MRFEHVLQIYWTKGFFYSGRLFYFDQTLPSLIPQLPGLGPGFKKELVNRFELSYIDKDIRIKDITLEDYQLSNFTPLFRPLNIIFSQVNSVNNRYNDLLRLIIIREYLIKSYRGRCHAIGKPVRGQRTWSNAWNSYNLNKVLRVFIGEARTQLNKNKVEEKINYKLTKKKYITKKKSIKTKVIKKKTWY